MRCTTDQQTLDDLRLFGKGGQGSIFTLFNRTVTRGGAAILEEWFRYPLGDEGQINQRSGVIKWFIAGGTPFPLRSELFDAIEQYLGNVDERTRLTGREQTLRDRVTGLVAEDSGYKVIYQGVMGLAEVVQLLRGFLSRVVGAGDGAGGGAGNSKGSGAAGGSPYAQEAAAISALLEEAPLAALAAVPLKSKLPYETVAAHDVLLRFRHRDVVRRLLGRIYLLDVFIAVAAVAREKGFCMADALPRTAQVLEVSGVYHPSVTGAVGNNISISASSNIVFLTGANMAGKSTFMKSLGIAVFLAHMGLPVPAAAMRFSVRDGIYTTINLADNLVMGASHFYAEVLRVKKVARELSEGKQLFVIFDELFRGTNVKDAYEATVALTAAFAGHRGSFFVISTHIIEAGDVLNKYDNINFVFLPTRMEGTRPVYTYTLEKGITADRHGMVIINNEGILEMLRKGKPKISKNRLV